MKILAFPAFRNRDSNPYNYLLNSAMESIGVKVGEFTPLQALVGDYDLIHVHWPEWYLNNPSWLKAFINNAVFLLALTAAKIRGKKIAWTIHNLRPHAIKHPILNRLFWFRFKKLVDVTLSLSEANKARFLEVHGEFLDSHNGVSYHGLYNDVYVNKTTKELSSEKLGVDNESDICLFLGQLKPYKNIEMLIDLFVSQTSLQDKLLLIAGKFDSPQYKQKIISQIGSASNIKLFEGFVHNDDLQYFFSVSKLTVLPFKNIFNSGSALLSASFGTAVLVPENENFKEYGSLLPGLIHTYTGELNADIILDAFKANTGFENEKINSLLDWSSIAEATKSTYQAALNGVPQS
ncbi:MAG: glycosyltransferase [Cellvibrionaceae bacterium]